MTEPVYARSISDLPDKATLLSISGLEFMQKMLRGEMPHPGISRLMGYHLHSVDPGRVAFKGRAGIEHTNPFGAVHGGWYGTLLDSALGCTVMTAVPKGRWYTTLEYKVNLLRALPLDVDVIAVGELDHAGRTTAVAHAAITGVNDGKLYATATTTCIILS